MQGMEVRGRRNRRPAKMLLLESREEWARCAVVADKVVFAVVVGSPLALNDRNTALDLEYYCH